jgi:uncharacterized protein (TIGR03437 family)
MVNIHKSTLKLLLLVVLSGFGTLLGQPRITSVFNAADYSIDLAPGSNVAIFGSGFATSDATASGLPLPTTLGGASVDISGTPMVLRTVSAGVINGQLPYGISGTVSVTVKNATGTSTAVPVTIIPNAPKFYTTLKDGIGYVVATHADFSLVSVTGAAAAMPGETIILFLNSMGAVTPPVAAGVAPGDGTPGKPLNMLVTPASVLLDTLPGIVTYAGLSPGLPGTYQVNFTTPYDDKIGDAALSVTVGARMTQSTVTLPVRSNGLYWVVTGGKFVNGQFAQTGFPGKNSSLAFRHNNPTAFGSNGNNAWTQNTGLGISFRDVASLALTLKNGGNIVFDNNGIETGTVGAYYENMPGSAVLFNMSSLTSPTSPASTVRGMFSGYFRLQAATTVTQMIGYFEGPVNVSPAFDPANIYNTFHMNLFSNVTSSDFFSISPKDTGGYTGDVFSSDTSPGAFTFATTGVDRVTPDGTRIPTYRLVYTLKTPMILPVGEYWFSHDVSTPATQVVSGTNSRPEVPANDSLKVRRIGPERNVKQ